MALALALRQPPCASAHPATRGPTFAGDYAQSALTDPIVLLVVAALLFVVWLVSLVAVLLLGKRQYRPTFWSNETAAEYTKRVKWDVQPAERLRAMLLVKVHPSLLRLIAPEARLWLGKNWARWTTEKPDWLTDGSAGCLTPSCRSMRWRSSAARAADGPR